MSFEQPEKVGYRNPPKQSRFTKGKSGNPGGRRRLKSGTIRDSMGELLESTWNVSDGTTYRDHIVAALLKNAMLGQSASVALILREFE